MLNETENGKKWHRFMKQTKLATKNSDKDKTENIIQKLMRLTVKVLLIF